MRFFDFRLPGIYVACSLLGLNEHFDNIAQTCPQCLLVFSHKIMGFTITSSSADNLKAITSSSWHLSCDRPADWTTGSKIRMTAVAMAEIYSVVFLQTPLKADNKSCFLFHFLQISWSSFKSTNKVHPSEIYRHERKPAASGKVFFFVFAQVRPLSTPTSTNYPIHTHKSAVSWGSQLFF